MEDSKSTLIFHLLLKVSKLSTFLSIFKIKKNKAQRALVLPSGVNFTNIL